MPELISKLPATGLLERSGHDKVIADCMLAVVIKNVKYRVSSSTRQVIVSQIVMSIADAWLQACNMSCTTCRKP